MTVIPTQCSVGPQGCQTLFAAETVVSRTILHHRHRGHTPNIRASRFKASITAEPYTSASINTLDRGGISHCHFIHVNVHEITVLVQGAILAVSAMGACITTHRALPLSSKLFKQLLPYSLVLTTRHQS